MFELLSKRMPSPWCGHVRLELFGTGRRRQLFGDV